MDADALFRSAILLDDPEVDLTRIRTMFVELNNYEYEIEKLILTKEPKIVKEAKYDLFNQMTLATVSELSNLVEKHYNFCYYCKKDFLCQDVSKNLFCSEKCRTENFMKK
jgi:hypothetical protein